MAIMTPTTHSDWIPADVLAREALRAKEPRLVIKSRCLNYDSEVSGQGQVISIAEVSNLVTNPVGANGEYTPQSPTEAGPTITVNVYREASFSVRDDLSAQSKLAKQRAYAPKIGQALAQYEEDTLLALETSITQIITIAGSVQDEDLRRLKQYLDDADADGYDRYLLLSPGQVNSVLGIDRYAQIDFGMYAKGKGPLATGKLVPILGMEPLTSTRVRRVLVSATTRTINMAWQKEAFAAAHQPVVKMERQRNGLAWDHIGSTLFGVTAARIDHAATAETTDA
jgi:hypothetical protein